MCSLVLSPPGSPTSHSYPRCSLPDTHTSASHPLRQREELEVERVKEEVGGREEGGWDGGREEVGEG